MCLASPPRRHSYFLYRFRVRAWWFFHLDILKEIWRNVFLFALQLFSFMFLRPPPIPTQGVSFNHTLTAHSRSPTVSNTPVCRFWSLFLIIFLVILKTSISISQSWARLSADPNWQGTSSQWTEERPGRMVSIQNGSSRLQHLQQQISWHSVKLGKAPEGALLSLQASWSSGPGHPKGTSFCLSYASIYAFICISKLQKVNNNTLE